MRAFKPRNWRRYYGYRPPSFVAIQFTTKAVKRQASAYLQWLASERGWTTEEAQAYVETAHAPALVEEPSQTAMWGF